MTGKPDHLTDDAGAALAESIDERIYPPADQGLFFGVALVVGAVMSSAFYCGELRSAGQSNFLGRLWLW